MPNNCPMNIANKNECWNHTVGKDECWLTNPPTPCRKLERICRTCGADRLEVHKSLKEAVDSDNYQLAIKIMQNCPDCTREIERAERMLSEVSAIGLEK
jgi:hypothetical protein